MKQDEAKRALAIFYPKCTKKHSRNECPLNTIEIRAICEEKHETKNYTFFLCMKASY